MIRRNPIRDHSSLHILAAVLVLAALCLLLGRYIHHGEPTMRRDALTGQVQVHVPAGEFIMGGDVTSPGRTGVESVTPEVRYLPGYWISRTQVTNWQYSRCVAAQACHLRVRRQLNQHYYNLAFVQHPIVYINWYDAEDFCIWVGGHLPTEAQWEKAARGPDGRSYPWGEGGDIVRLAYVGRDRDSRTTRPVGLYPQGASPYGALDMGGNVREWVQDWHDAGRKVLRGAAWFDPPSYSLTYARLAHEPGSAGISRGFRCAWDE